MGDFALQFMADFIRGPEPTREEKHLARQMKLRARKGPHSSSMNAKNTAKSQGEMLSKAELKKLCGSLESTVKCGVVTLTETFESLSLHVTS